MAREILFKAKRIDNGEWVEGYYCKYGYTGKEKHYIIPNYASDLYTFEIDINTLCQYTGLTDKNGNKIWENDVVRVDKRLFHVHYYEPFGMYMLYGIGFGGGVNGMIVQLKTSEVIGNIFDNPELLEMGCE